MSDGLEHFTHGWKNNETYKHSFSDGDLDSSGFNWLVMGNLNLATNIYAAVSTFDPIGPPITFGVKLVSVVTTILGATVPTVIITVSYTTAGLAIHTTQFLLIQGSAPPDAKVVSLTAPDTVLYSVTSASTNHAISGTIQLLSPRYVTEIFSSDWGAPDPGL